MESFFTSETIGIISIALLIVGFLKFILYYKSFGIPIVDYIDPSEIVTLFADNIATASLIVFVLAIPYLSIILPYNLAGVDIGLHFMSRLNSHFSVLGILIVISGMVLIALIAFMWKRKRIYNFELVRFVWAWVLIAIVLPMITLETSAYYKIQSFQYYIVIVSLILSFALLILLATWNEIEKVKNHGDSNGTLVEFEDCTMKFIATDLYVGKTKSYLFFYSAITKSSTAYSTSKLKSIQYPPR